MNLTIQPLTPSLWPALEALFGKGGASNGCWCMYWRIGAEYHKRPRKKNKSAFRRIVKQGPAGCWLSMGIWPWAGVSSRRDKTCAGSIANQLWKPSMIRRSGRSHAFICGVAIAEKESCRL